eukprot:ANDGO_01756.mRNA.1 hypothetical protein
MIDAIKGRMLPNRRRSSGGSSGGGAESASAATPTKEQRELAAQKAEQRIATERKQRQDEDISFKQASADADFADPRNLRT